MNSTLYKIIEFFILFILVPVSFALNYAPIIKFVIGGLGFVYVIYVLLKVEQVALRLRKNIKWQLFWKTTLIKFLFIALATTGMVWVTNRASLFIMPLNKPLLWGVIIFLYSMFSVYPQELIYRTFYFKRYQFLFKNKNVFIFINAMVFSLAHIFFKSFLVLTITFIGGVLFALTFRTTRSTLLVSIEHACYGCWLFTIGMGEMLGFPI